MKLTLGFGRTPKTTSARLYLSDKFWSKLQAKVLAYNGMRGNEQAFYVLCRRVWHDGAPCFYPVETYIPKYDDYQIQKLERVALKPSKRQWILDRVASGNLHLLHGHSHPDGSSISPSTPDIQSFQSTGVAIQQMHGQRQLIAVVSDSMLRLNTLHVSLYSGVTQQGIELIRCSELPNLGMEEYILAGSLLMATHRCPKPVIPVSMSEQLKLPHSEIRVEVWGGDADNKVLLKTDPDHVMVRVVQWSKDCNCGNRLDKGEITTWGYVESLA